MGMSRWVHVLFSCPFVDLFEVSVYNVYGILQACFKPILLKAGGGGEGVKSVVIEVTVNSMEKNAQDFCLNYVLEFGLTVLSCKG